MIQLDLKIVGLVIGIIFLLSVGILLVIALIKFIKLLNKANSILDSNAKNINNVLAVLPEVTENFNEACKNASYSFGNVGELTENVNDIVSTASGAEDIVTNFANAVTIVSNIISFITGIFSKSEK